MEVDSIHPKTEHFSAFHLLSLPTYDNDSITDTVEKIISDKTLLSL